MRACHSRLYFYFSSLLRVVMSALDFEFKKTLSLVYYYYYYYCSYILMQVTKPF